MAGQLYGVGVGPGDPELITVKAIRVLKSCPVLAAPASGGEMGIAYEIACGAVPELQQKEWVALELPMVRDPEKLAESRRKAANELIEPLKNDKNVAVLTLGDPSVYSTYSYLQELVCTAGYTAHVVPGVPSFCAAAASIGESLTVAGEPFRVLPGSYSCTEEELKGTGTKILMKTGGQLSKIKDFLQENGQLENAVLIENCGMRGERVLPLAEVQKAGYFSVIIIK